jgi:hypothetical protein
LKKTEVGGLMANDVFTFIAVYMPSGDVKLSGTSWEVLCYAIEEMTE